MRPSARGMTRDCQMQQVLEQITKTAALVSNVQKKMSDTSAAVLQNIK
jgi:hypothetical protein